MINASRKNAVLINVLSTYTNTFISIVIGILLVPFYLKYFSSNLYGSWLASAGVISMFSLLEGGISQILTQRLAISYGKKNSEAFIVNFSSGICLIGFLSLLVIIIGFFIAPLITKIVNADTIYYPVLIDSIRLATLGSAFSILQVALLSTFYAWQNTIYVAIISIISALLSIIVVITTLFNGLGIISLSFGILAKGGVGLLLSIFFVYAHLKKNYSKIFLIKIRHIKKLFYKSGPLYLSKISSTFASNFESIIIANYINPTAVVIYSITGKVINTASSFINPIAGSILGSFSNLIASGNKNSIQNSVKQIFYISTSFTFLIIPVLICLNSEIINLWVGSDMYGGIFLTFLFGIYCIIQLRINLMNSFLSSFGEFRYISYIDILYVFIKICFYFLLLKFFGVWILLFIQIVLLSIVSFLYISRLKRHISISLFSIAKEIIIVLSITSLLFFLINHFFIMNDWRGLVLKSAIYFTLLFVILYISSSTFRNILHDQVHYYFKLKK